MRDFKRGQVSGGSLIKNERVFTISQAKVILENSIKPYVTYLRYSSLICCSILLVQNLTFYFLSTIKTKLDKRALRLHTEPCHL